MENPKIKWMITGSIPILGNSHIYLGKKNNDLTATLLEWCLVSGTIPMPYFRLVKYYNLHICICICIIIISIIIIIYIYVHIMMGTWLYIYIHVTLGYDMIWYGIYTYYSGLQRFCFSNVPAGHFCRAWDPYHHQETLGSLLSQVPYTVHIQLYPNISQNILKSLSHNIPYIHTYVRTYVRTYIHRSYSNIHTDIQTYIQYNYMQTRCRTDLHVRSPETSQLQDFIEKVQAEPPKDRPRDSYVSGRTVGWIELG